MTTAWIEGATVVNGVADGGSMVGGGARITWHTTENDPHTTTARNIANYLNQTRNVVHIVWNPETGEIVVMLPKDVAGRGLKNASGGVETNREGTVNIQVEVVGRASQPFTSGPMVGLDRLLRVFDDLVPRTWPSGAPLASSSAYGSNPSRSTTHWKQAGHFGHSQVPENDHSDPGAIDISKLFGGKPSPHPAPHPAPSPAPAPSRYVRENGDGLYERGEFGPGIKTVQTQLTHAGYHVTADGYFGLDTLNAVKAFQKAYHLTADGVVGPRTLSALGQTHVHPAGPGLKVDGVMGPTTMKALQAAVGVKPDGWFKKTGVYTYDLGHNTTVALMKHLHHSGTSWPVPLQQHVHVKADGSIGHDTIVALQRVLNARAF